MEAMEAVPVLHRGYASEPGLLGQTALSRMQTVKGMVGAGWYYQARRKLCHIADRLFMYGVTPAASLTSNAHTSDPALAPMFSGAVPASAVVEPLAHHHRFVCATQSGFCTPKYRTQIGGAQRQYS